MVKTDIDQNTNRANHISRNSFYIPLGIPVKDTIDFQERDLLDLNKEIEDYKTLAKRGRLCLT